jgi:hypothetical protein
MPRVPEYQPDQINQSRSADVSQNIQTSQETFGVGAGRAVQQLGGTVLGFAGQLQKREDETRARDAYINGFEKPLTNRESDPASSFYNKMGRNAYDGLDGEKEYIEELSRGLLENAETEGERRQLNALIQNRKASIFDAYGRHALREYKQWDISTHEGAAQNAVRNGVNSVIVDTNNRMAPINKELIDQLEIGRVEFGSALRKKGVSEEEVRAQTDIYESNFHKQVIVSLMQDNPAKAKFYFDKFSDNINPDTRKSISDELDRAGRIQEAQTNADRIMMLGDDPMKYTKEIKDPEIRNATEQLVRIYQADRERAKGLREEAQIRDVWQSLFVNPNPKNIPKTLPPDQYLRMMKYVEDKASGKDIETDWNSYQMLIKEAANPQTRAKFAQRNLYTEMRPFLADTEFKEVLRIQAGINEGKKETKLDLDRVFTNQQVLTQRLEQAGINAAPKPGTKEAEKLAKFQQRVDMVIRQKEKQSGVAVSGDEYLAEVDNMLRKVIVDENWYGDTEKLKFDASLEDIGDVPSDYVGPITNALKKQGKAVSSEAIKYYYFQWLQQNKAADE